MRGTTKRTVQKAKALRRDLTPHEAKLWTALRRRNLGPKFRRQHPVGPYVLDFYCPAAKLCIEVDGAAHDMGNNPARDERRDQWLAGHGINVLRISAADVMSNLDAVYRLVLEACAEKPLHQPAAGPPPHRLRRQGG